MLLDRARHFYQVLEASKALAESATLQGASLYSPKGWLAVVGTPETDLRRIGNLERARSSASPFRELRGKVAWFWVESFEAVIVLGFTASPRSSSLRRVQEILETEALSAKNSWGANRDDLTGLYNRHGFSERISAEMANAIERSATSNEATLGVSPGLAVLAFDIDNFKAVNDSYGHLYGNVVLSAFARRLGTRLKVCPPVRERRLRFVLGRIGGEEFEVALVGQVTEEDLGIVAEEMRQAVRDAPLPSEEDWSTLGARASDAGVSLPPISERRITTSIGVSSRARLAELDIDRLTNEADIALYRAKAGGKDVCRRFSDILARHGTVLEHHAEMEIIVIDIGRNVNVRLGQEFVVFHPDFGGDTPFHYSDGRSKKRLGLYPKASSGRVVVFDVQKEVSFCRVVENTGRAPFRVGSRLEVVPLGSIAHLLPRSPTGAAFEGETLIGESGLAAAVAEMVRTNARPHVLVAKLEGAEQLAEERGSAFVNQSLAAIYAILRERFPAARSVGQVSPTEFAVVADTLGEDHGLGAGNQVVDDVATKCGSICRVRVGIFGPDMKTKLRGDKSEIVLGAALDLARYAVVADPKTPGAATFTPAIAGKLLQRLRADHRYADALTDYRKLSAAGIRYAYLENTAALCAFEGGRLDDKVMIDAIRLAVELDPEERLFRANEATFTFALGDRVQAGRMFLQLEDAVLPEVYQPYRALALAALSFDRPDAVARGTVISVLKGALQLGDDVVASSRRAELERALQAIPVEATAHGNNLATELEGEGNDAPQVARPEDVRGG